MAAPHLIPWKSKQEWLTVYEDAYSQDYERTKSSVQTMNEWSNFMRSASRPGMDCTCGLLEILLKDNYVFVEATDPFNISNLQLMYSTQIMRFLNFTVDTSLNPRKISLYRRAKEIGIPDWIVNIRHEVAHRNQLPSIDIIRMAVQYILDWLQKQYWEYEKNGMSEVKLEKVEDLVPTLLSSLLYSYILLKEQSILGFKKVCDIQDPDIKQVLIEINSFRLIEVKRHCKPWEVKENEDNKVDLRKFFNSSIKIALFTILNLLKQYFLHEEKYGVNTINILIDRMIDDSVEHNGMRRDIWGLLLRKMHSWYKFSVMIGILVKKSYEYKGEGAYQAGMWTVELCKALQKRFKVEDMSTTLGESNANINLNSSQHKEFSKLIIKNKLKISEKKDCKIFASLFLRVEQMHVDLKDILRLKEAIFPDRWEVLDLIKVISEHPTEFTEQCLIAVYDILKSPFSLEHLNNLVNITKIYRGEGIRIKKRKRLFKVKHLMKPHELSAEEGFLENDTSMLMADYTTLEEDK